MGNKTKLLLLLVVTAAIGGLTPVVLKNTKTTSLEKTAATMPTYNVEISKFDITGSYYFDNGGTSFSYNSSALFSKLKNPGNYCFLEPQISDKTYNGDDYLLDATIRSSSDRLFRLGIEYTTRYYYRSETKDSKIYTPNLSNLHVVKLYMHKDNEVELNGASYEHQYDLNYDSEENSWTYTAKKSSFIEGLSSLYFRYDVDANMNKRLKIKKIVLTYDCE